jgi:hypothetical protein
MMGTTIVLGREDDRSRDVVVVMEGVVENSFSAKFRGVWALYKARLDMSIRVGETTR